jgi:hypothetical protein
VLLSIRKNYNIVCNKFSKDIPFIGTRVQRYITFISFIIVQEKRENI